MINRRKFISKSIDLACAAGIVSSISSCQPVNKINGSLSGPNHTLGHRLYQRGFPQPKEIIKTDIAVVGGGISGLSAARQLSIAGVEYILLEMENAIGGNSSQGGNSISAYPLGAHYLPVPGVHDKDLLLFLEECGAITGYENGKPVYNDYYLCFEPKERLYIHSHWQEGLVPRDGLNIDDTVEFTRLHELMQHYRDLRGSDGREAFCIPISECSIDPTIRKLDKITFGQFLKANNFRSPYLIWYTNYCCADDFGGNIWNVSAWAGIHYFSSRKGVSSNAPLDAVLTWPEGNGWLASKLKKHSESKTLSNCLVYSVAFNNHEIQTDYFDPISKTSKRIVSEKVIMATPQFVNQRILSSSLDRKLDYNSFSYAPWMVANLTYSGSLEDKRGEQLSWDNVIYGSSSLGYVNANHQNLNLHSGKRVLTYYFPMTGNDYRAERQVAYKRDFKNWYDVIISDLKTPHPDIEKGIEAADIWLWGHGMIRPSVGFMSEISSQASAPLHDRIFFVHTDVSGISIFEEAFNRGTHAAKSTIAV